MRKFLCAFTLAFIGLLVVFESDFLIAQSRAASALSASVAKEPKKVGLNEFDLYVDNDLVITLTNPTVDNETRLWLNSKSIIVEKKSWKFKTPFRLNQFKLLSLEHLVPKNIQNCDVNLIIKTVSPSQVNPGTLLKKSFRAYIFTPVSVETTKRVDIWQVKIKKRNWRYVLGRQFNLAPEDVLVYQLKPDGMILQRRLHLNLSNVKAMQVVMSRPVDIKTLNLRIKVNSRFGSEKIIDVAGFSNVSQRPDGKFVLNINLESKLSREFKGVVDNDHNQRLYLDEISIFTPIYSNPSGGDVPIDSIIFNEQESKVNVGNFDGILESESRPTSYGRIRTILNIENILLRGGIFLDGLAIESRRTPGDNCMISPTNILLSTGLNLKQSQESANSLSENVISSQELSNKSNHSSLIFFISSIFGFLLFLTLYCSVLLPVFRPIFKLVWKVWWIPFLSVAFISANFYFIAFRIPVAFPMNYWVLFGAIFSVASFHQFWLGIRGYMFRAFPMLSSVLYQNSGAIFFLGALTSIFLAEALNILSLEFIADQVALIALIFLTAGSIGGLLWTRKYPLA